MHVHRLTHAIDVHAAGWPLRVLTLPGAGARGMPLAEWARALWQGEDGRAGDPSPVRWLQREPRGHAAMRIGVVVPSAGGPADVSLLVFDANGPCRADGLDAICAAAAMDESGFYAGSGGPTRRSLPGKAIQTDHCVYRVREREDEGAAYAVLVAERPASIVERGRPFPAGHLALAADIMRFDGETYAIINVQGSGLALRIDRFSELKAAARGVQSQLPSPSNVILIEGDTGHAGRARIAVFDAYGNLLRAPESRALHAMMTLLSEGDTGRMSGGLTAEGLNGGTLTCRAAARQTDDSSGALRESPWEIACRPFVTGSLQFVMDPDDEAGEGFLLR